ncbi:MAG: hypothetical protein CMM28_10795 [Rhodospirillaceae bacterium]|nr:hypothetical protein [Rhodospirillaceae bacterium]
MHSVGDIGELVSWMGQHNLFGKKTLRFYAVLNSIWTRCGKPIRAFSQLIELVVKKRSEVE